MDGYGAVILRNLTHTDTGTIDHSSAHFNMRAHLHLEIICVLRSSPLSHCGTFVVHHKIRDVPSSSISNCFTAYHRPACSRQHHFSTITTF